MQRAYIRVVDDAELANVGAWMRRALCREYPETNFFPARGESSAPAKAICGSCAVRDECDAYADALPVDIAAHGIWAGVPGRARAAARARRRAA